MRTIAEPEGAQQAGVISADGTVSLAAALNSMSKPTLEVALR